MVDGYVSTEELKLILQLEHNINICDINVKNQDLALQKAHAEKRAAEAELRAAQAEYNGTMMKMLWTYKLEKSDSIRQSDGFIIKGDNKDGEQENRPDDTSK